MTFAGRAGAGSRASSGSSRSATSPRAGRRQISVRLEVFIKGSWVTRKDRDQIGGFFWNLLENSISSFFFGRLAKNEKERKRRVSTLERGVATGVSDEQTVRRRRLVLSRELPPRARSAARHAPPRRARRRRVRARGRGRPRRGRALLQKLPQKPQASVRQGSRCAILRWGFESLGEAGVWAERYDRECVWKKTTGHVLEYTLELSDRTTESGH